MVLNGVMAALMVSVSAFKRVEDFLAIGVCYLSAAVACGRRFHNSV